jgi:hypothetical protein
MVSRAALPVLVLLACAATPIIGQDKKPGAAEGNKSSRLDLFKQLAGEWVGTATPQLKDAKEVHVTYKVTSGGSAVVETLFPGTEHEMVTVIHRDGDDLLLTHYCMLGNQPQMKAPATGDGNKVEFKFVRATNLKSDKDMHMHDVTFTFVDKDTLRTEWTHFKDGKAAGQVVSELKRKK